MNKYIQSDLFRYRNNTSLRSFIREYLRNPGFRYMVAHRLTNSKSMERIPGNVLFKLNRNHNLKIPKDVKIGNNVTVGAGSVVTKDIPDNATAAGNYAKVLNYNNPQDILKIAGLYKKGGNYYEFL